MRVAMITFGSQGDVRPLVALGQGLVRTAWFRIGSFRVTQARGNAGL